MKQVTTIFLKLAVIFIGIPVLALCIFLVPRIGNFAGELYPNIAYMKSLVLIDMYAAAIPFYFALYQAFKLLSYIDKNKAFSELSVKALKNIKFCAITISILYLLGMPLYYLMSQKIDPPSFMPIGLVIIFGSIVIAVFAAVLQRLLQEAINIKSENDLTI
jgi:ABC-type proline/glycine betaine transport system permease subunit